MWKGFANTIPIMNNRIPREGCTSSYNLWYHHRVTGICRLLLIKLIQVMIIRLHLFFLGKNLWRQICQWYIVGQLVIYLLFLFPLQTKWKWYLDILKEQKVLLFLYSMLPYTLPNLKKSSNNQNFRCMKQLMGDFLPLTSPPS